MAIKIKTRKVPSLRFEGGMARRIVEIEVLSLVDLPVEYKKARPFCCRSCGGGLVIHRTTETDSTEYINPEEVISEIKFQEMVSWIKKCAEKLSEVNSLRKSQLLNWGGEETIVI